MNGQSEITDRALASLVATGGDAIGIAATTIEVLHAIDAALSPIISERGVAALYRRSLFLIRDNRPWVGPVYTADQSLGDFSALHVAISAQPDDEALSGADALLTTFHELLTSLIGESLTGRLLRPVLQLPSSGDAVQDTAS